MQLGVAAENIHELMRRRAPPGRTGMGYLSYKCVATLTGTKITGLLGRYLRYYYMDRHMYLPNVEGHREIATKVVSRGSNE